LLAAAAVLAVSGWAHDRYGGSFASWLEAISTFAAFLAAAVAIVFAATAYRLEVGREQQFRAAGDRAQASLVAAWWGPDPDAPGDEGRRFGIWIRNASELPIRRAGLELRVDDKAIEDTVLALVPPARDAILVPIAHETLHVLDEIIRAKSEEADARVRLTLDFTDAGGLKWHRSGKDGILRQIIDGKIIANSKADLMSYPW
jgi:hypothetical protein